MTRRTAIRHRIPTVLATLARIATHPRLPAHRLILSTGEDDRPAPIDEVVRAIDDLRHRHPHHREDEGIRPIRDHHRREKDTPVNLGRLLAEGKRRVHHREVTADVTSAPTLICCKSKVYAFSEKATCIRGYVVSSLKPL